MKVGLNLILLDKILQKGIEGFENFEMLKKVIKALSFAKTNSYFVIEQQVALFYYYIIMDYQLYSQI